MLGDIYIWKDNVMIRAILRAHEGPIFTMYTSLFDGCIVTGSKEKKYKIKWIALLIEFRKLYFKMFLVPKRVDQ